MDLLDNPAHRDAWGSTTAIPMLLGGEPDGGPWSELWMGAHPAAPSRVVDPDADRGGGRSLAEVIEADPVATLGPAVLEAYGARLPFLLKVLAAARPLSMQAHPSRAHAAAGFADEERRGVRLDDPRRNYADAEPKPELLCALTEFHALCGFRPVADTMALLERLEVAALEPEHLALQSSPDAAGVRVALTALLHRPETDRAALIAEVARRCRELATAGDPDAALAQTVVELAAEYPGDPGVLCALLMHRVTLQPGEAIFLDAGNLHAYLRGVGVEVMASSDNVLRAGLTARHVDVDELLAVLDTAPGPLPRVVPVVRDHVVEYPVPVQDFRLSRLRVGVGRSHELDAGLPRILLVTDGRLEITQPGQVVQLAQGQAVFLPAGDPPGVLTGEGTAYLATTSAPVPVREAAEVAAG